MEFIKSGDLRTVQKNRGKLEVGGTREHVPYLITYLHTYLLISLLHTAESFLRS